MHALIIEDNALIALQIQDALHGAGFISTECVVSQNEAVAAVNRTLPHLITSDVSLAPGNGVDAVRAILKHRVIPVLFVTSLPAEVRRRMPGAHVLTKPFSAAELTRHVNELMQTVAQ